MHPDLILAEQLDECRSDPEDQWISAGEYDDPAMVMARDQARKGRLQIRRPRMPYLPGVRRKEIEVPVPSQYDLGLQQQVAFGRAERLPTSSADPDHLDHPQDPSQPPHPAPAVRLDARLSLRSRLSYLGGCPGPLSEANVHVRSRRGRRAPPDRGGGLLPPLTQWSAADGRPARCGIIGGDAAEESGVNPERSRHCDPDQSGSQDVCRIRPGRRYRLPSRTHGWQRAWTPAGRAHMMLEAA